MKRFILDTLFKPTSVSSRTAQAMYDEQIVGIRKVVNHLGLEIIDTVIDDSTAPVPVLGYYCLIGYPGTDIPLFWMGTANVSQFYNSFCYGVCNYYNGEYHPMIVGYAPSNIQMDTVGFSTYSMNLPGVNAYEMPFQRMYGTKFPNTNVNVNFACWETDSGYKAFSCYLSNNRYTEVCGASTLILAPIADSNGLIENTYLPIITYSFTQTNSTYTHSALGLIYGANHELGIDSTDLSSGTNSGTISQHPTKSFVIEPMLNKHYFVPFCNHVAGEKLYWPLKFFVNENVFKGYHIPNDFLYLIYNDETNIDLVERKYTDDLTAVKVGISLPTRNGAYSKSILCMNSNF